MKHVKKVSLSRDAIELMPVDANELSVLYIRCTRIHSLSVYVLVYGQMLLAQSL